LQRGGAGAAGRAFRLLATPAIEPLRHADCRGHFLSLLLAAIITPLRHRLAITASAAIAAMIVTIISRHCRHTPLLTFIFARHAAAG